MTNKAMQTVEQLERRILWAGGDLDTTFGTGGVVRDHVGAGASRDNIRDIAIDAQGRIYAVGAVVDGPDYGNVLRRYLPSGAIDTSFGGGDGRVNFGVADESVSFMSAIAIQPDGKIVMAGQHSYFTRPADAPAVHHNDVGV